MNLRDEFLVRLTHMIDDLANLASDLDHDPDEIARLRHEADQTVVTLWETAT